MRRGAEGRAEHELKQLHKERESIKKHLHEIMVAIRDAANLDALQIQLLKRQHKSNTKRLAHINSMIRRRDEQ
jgi:chaperonin cofactor prefoldin